MTRVHAARRQPDRRICPRAAPLSCRSRPCPKLVIAAFLSAEDKNFYKHAASTPKASCAPSSPTSASRRQAPAGRLDHHPAGRQELPAVATSGPTSARSRRRCSRSASSDLSPRTRSSSSTSTRSISAWAIYGIAAAALNYFGKSVHELTHRRGRLSRGAAEGARTTTTRSARREAAIERRNWVIDRMVENGYITREDGDEAQEGAAQRQPARRSRRTRIASGYFAEEVRREIAERYGEKKLYEGGLSVRTTLDPKMQAMARKALVDGLVRFDEARGWRGAQQKIDLAGRDWGLALGRGAGARRRAALAAGRRARGRRRTGARSACSRSARPPARSSRERETGTRRRPTASKWTRTAASSAGAARRATSSMSSRWTASRASSACARSPRSRARIVAMDPHTGRVLRHGRRLLLRPERVQPRDPGHAPAGLLVQAVRLRGGARQRLHAVQRSCSTRRSDRHGSGPGSLDAGELRRQVDRPAHAALRHRAVART